MRLMPDTNFPYVARIFDNTNSKSTFRYGANWEAMHKKRWPYFGTTNSFCGPLVLYDSTGKNVPLLKPEINRLSAYPDQYSLKCVSGRFWRDNTIKMDSIDVPKQYWMFGDEKGIVGPEYFNLWDYFKPEEVGNYELTVWPKAYRRSATNDDICDRIDFPPVKIPVKWNGELKK